MAVVEQVAQRIIELGRQILVYPALHFNQRNPGEKDALTGRWWLPRMLLWAGRRSYSIYLCHIPVMYTMRETAYRLGWNMDHQVLLSIAACACLIALVGNASSQWVEWPIRRRGMAYTATLMARHKSTPATAS